jgi:hypothetical protein
MDPILSYYQKHGQISDPGAYAPALDGLPTQIEALARVVQATTIHPFWTESYGLKPPPERMAELQLRTLEKRLARTLELDPRPLDEPRDLDKKLLGNCRDHSLLLTALLRQQGTAARARCGFGAYFQDGLYIDHWVVEYWDQARQRWVLVDAQLDTLQSETLRISFDPLDVPRDQFIVAGRAWQMCRSGRADPAAFGIFDMSGLGFIRGNLLRDVASLNKVELLPWDCWGLMLKDQVDDPSDLAMLDQLAALTAGDVPDPQAVRSAYENDPRLYMDGSLESYIDGIKVPVKI